MSNSTNVTNPILSAEVTLNEDSIVAYLEKETGFFERHPELLLKLKLPHETGPAVSLVERQIDVLREKNRKLEQKIVNLVQIAQDNEVLEEQLHRISQHIIEIDRTEDIFPIINNLLSNEFPSLFVRLCLYGPNENLAVDAYNQIKDADLQVRVLHQIIRENARNCIFVRGKRLEGLFAAGENVKSAVAIPLKTNKNFGALVLGSSNENRFYEGMGTLFLEHLADLLARKLKKLLPR